MSSYPMTTGEIPFEVPAAGKPCHTWYKTVGDIRSSTPLILLHGGPGAGHDYFLPFVDLVEKHSIPIIFYDQLGCGKSTHLREKAGDERFWTIDLFLSELDNLIDHLGIRSSFYLYGQSWGGMMAGVYAARQPHGLNRLILSSTPASSHLFSDATKKLLKLLPKDVQAVLDECEREGDHESEKWENACMEFYARFICRLDPWPQELLEGFGNLKEDPTVYNTMQGLSEFECTGSLKDWEGFSEAHKINVETLLLNGRYDEMTDEVVRPWYQKIAKVKWITLEKSAHMGHWEERERYIEIIADFLK